MACPSIRNHEKFTRNFLREIFVEPNREILENGNNTNKGGVIMAKTLKEKISKMISETGLLYILLALEEIYSKKAYDYEQAGNDEKALQCRKISHLMLDVNAETCHWKV